MELNKGDKVRMKVEYYEDCFNASWSGVISEAAEDDVDCEVLWIDSRGREQQSWLYKNALELDTLSTDYEPTIPVFEIH